MDSQNSITQLLAAKRILVLGSSGSGKTTFSLHLSRILNLKVIHLDSHFWKPGWVPTPQSEWRETIHSLIQTETWIMDGTYESSLDLRIPAADQIILVESSRLACLWRVLKRKAVWDDHRRPDAPSGQKLDLAFLRYVWQYPRVTAPFVWGRILQYGSNKEIIRLKGLKGIHKFLLQLEQTVAKQTGAN